MKEPTVLRNGILCGVLLFILDNYFQIVNSTENFLMENL